MIAKLIQRFRRPKPALTPAPKKPPMDLAAQLRQELREIYHNG